MYIPDFWCGVLATVAAEFVAVIIGSIVSKRKETKK